MRGGKSRRREASMNHDNIVLNAFYSKTPDTSNISSNERVMFVQSILNFHNIWTEVRKQVSKKT